MYCAGGLKMGFWADGQAGPCMGRCMDVWGGAWVGAWMNGVVHRWGVL